MTLEAFAPVADLAIDQGIREAVLKLRAGGVETFESCEGGEGHAFAEPTVRFHGDAWAGYRAFAVAMENGLRPVSVRRVYDVISDQLVGAWWEIVFSPRTD